MSRGVRVARWLAAVIMIAYGFAKLTGSQFTVLDSEVTKRAHMAVFRFDEGDAVHHFEVDSGHVRVWEAWKEKGPLIYEGEIVDTGRIELRPSGGGSPVVLIREQPAATDESRTNT